MLNVANKVGQSRSVYVTRLKQEVRERSMRCGKYLT